MQYCLIFIHIIQIICVSLENQNRLQSDVFHQKTYLIGSINMVSDFQTNLFEERELEVRKNNGTKIGPEAVPLSVQVKRNESDL